MKQKLTPEQKQEIEKFGANSWYLDYLQSDSLNHEPQVPQDQIPPKSDQSKRGNGQSNSFTTQQSTGPATKSVTYPQGNPNDTLKLLAGAPARIIDNMEASLALPVATTQRVIPVKLLEENRILINNHLQKLGRGKVSFTHLIGWGIIKSLKKYPSLNNAFTVKDGKPHLVQRGSINLGIAIDVEKKDGSRSLLVPNIKNCDTYDFAGFLAKYEDLVKRSRAGQIDPAEFAGTTITLTNPGTLGTVGSVPRLMVGQGAIIATGAIQYPAEYQAMSAETISTLGISKVLTLTSTYDHRIIQGAESGLYLKELHELLLGQDGFYEEVFESLNIPLKPNTWETDIQPRGYNDISNLSETEKQARVLQLINMFRVRGHLVASIDPLGTKNIYHSELDPSFHKLTIWDLDRQFITGGFGGLKTATLRKILDILQSTYCEKIGVEYMHIQNHEEKLWLQSIMEPNQNKPQLPNEVKIRLLQKLIQAEGFEHFIHNRFVGHKRFSLEGSETVIPVLDYILDLASQESVEEIVLGMAHRGRLNVLANIVGKSYESIFSEFEDIIDPNSYQGSGDVKYHLGASGMYKTLNGNEIGISIASNPSHLEWVNPVVEGIVRAKQTRLNGAGESKIIPLLIHGDAAFAGQGVVAETFNLSQLKGYRTGGTIHLVINNQIGFTTTAEDARSSVYATDVAKMIQAPIFHVNGDDPEAALWVAKIAYLYRQKYKKDVVIDLLGYRKHGHNEGDEPGYTQPLLYEKIKSHPSVVNIYSDKLVRTGLLDENSAGGMKSAFSETLSNALDKVKRKHIDFKIDIPLAISKDKIRSFRPTHKTAVDEQILRDVIAKITTVPSDFQLHPKLKKFLEKRADLAIGKEAADWSLGEALAFATLLKEGVFVRLSGQDVVRGTFSQRHLGLTNIRTGEEYLTVNHMYPDQAKMEAYDSLLSEAAVLGFEYGFSTANPLALVIWEAQFGDFANSAQVIIDNFIVASYEKWHVPSNVVLMLPHGFEGQGPEHSSARIERFLILCAQDNMEVCNPTTPAQLFHLLRRHVRKGLLRPLVIMTPKSLLRSPEAKSEFHEFTTGTFEEIIDDKSVNKETVNRVVLTSGKVYYELNTYRKEKNHDDAAIVRFEQYYPYDESRVKELLSSYPKANKVIWVQEEPKNMGAWNFLHGRLPEDLSEGQRLIYAGRPASASPAVGSSKVARQQQDKLIFDAFNC
ncbi:MAG: multifunctional oxoglutarate decarboxylase/oxoglutarate dehydrogenase thiamine pyrophosphate-binding subunit/dihydrolipoyllysine-residue succinyltransferase subunit [Ignavibacteriaceae bacterium]|nr:multifunctional oxoglutarate decarboxylase/oxoglutarate dehydrogenase thiamine pyrophosphate-binding subunit/dihydrolipoyllysine-residue succinyltransferase subunit [Ignavibacteriaceae bacterium]